MKYRFRVVAKGLLKAILRGKVFWSVLQWERLLKKKILRASLVPVSNRALEFLKENTESQFFSWIGNNPAFIILANMELLFNLIRVLITS